MATPLLHKNHNYKPAVVGSVSNMILASKMLMALEGLALAYLTFLGLLMVLGGSFPMVFGSFSSEHVANFVTSILVLIFLVSGWRIYFWAILGNFGTRGNISKYWFVVSGVAVIFTALSTLIYELSSQRSASNIWYMQSQIFMLGLWFIPTATHIFLHVLYENISNKSRKADGLQPPIR